MSCISNILVTAVLRATRKPNGKFSGNFFWLVMLLTHSVKESNSLGECVLFTRKSDLCCLAKYNFIFLNSAQSSDKKKQLENLTNSC